MRHRHCCSSALRAFAITVHNLLHGLFKASKLYVVIADCPFERTTGVFMSPDFTQCGTYSANIAVFDTPMVPSRGQFLLLKIGLNRT
jgi:hypothetical protein